MNAILLSLAVANFAWLGEAPVVAPPQLTPARAAVLYRIAIYDTFRTERAEYAKRREAGDLLWNRFESQNQPKHFQAAVTDWFVQAREASLPGQIQTLPPLPELQAKPQVAELQEPGPAVAKPTTGAPELVPVERTRDDIPAGAVTTLDVRLPPEAFQTGPTRFFSGMMKQAFPVSTQAHEVSSLRSPPKAKVNTLPELTPPTVTLPPQADQVHPHLERQPQAVPLTKTPEPKPTTETFNFDHLFEPATTTPVPQASADPFAP